MKNRKLLNFSLAWMVFSALCCYAVAQNASELQKEITAHVTAVTTEGMARQGGNATFAVVASELGFESKVVKGVPFSADTVNEFTQVLGTGQRIYRRSTSSIYRDSEGRTRREQIIDVIGPYISSGHAHHTISIHDPVAGVKYTLNPEDHTASKMTIAIPTESHLVFVPETGAGDIVKKIEVLKGGVVSSSGIVGGVVGVAEAGTASTTKHATSASHTRTEVLPAQIIEGVEATGTRIIETIPTGAIGNDSPIEIISEKWYSAELGMVVKSTHSNPMSGDTFYQLKNIRRGEPDPSLFTVPPEYKVKEGGAIHIQTIRKDGHN